VVHEALPRFVATEKHWKWELEHDLQIMGMPFTGLAIRLRTAATTGEKGPNEASTKYDLQIGIHDGVGMSYVDETHGLWTRLPYTIAALTHPWGQTKLTAGRRYEAAMRLKVVRTDGQEK